MDSKIQRITKCGQEWPFLSPEVKQKYNNDSRIYINNCLQRAPPSTQSFGQSVQNMAGRAYGALPSMSNMYNALPNVSGRARTFYMNNINTDQFGNSIGYRPAPDANGHRGGKRRTKKSKGAKKSRKAKGGKRKGRKSRRYK